MADVCGFCGPILLNLLINFIEEGNKDAGQNDVGQGYLYVLGMLAASLIGKLQNGLRSIGVIFIQDWTGLIFHSNISTILKLTVHV